MGKPAGRRPSVAKKKALLTKPPFSVRTFGGTALWAFKSGPSEMLFPWPQAPHHRGLFLFPRPFLEGRWALAVNKGPVVDSHPGQMSLLTQGDFWGTLVSRRAENGQ